MNTGTILDEVEEVAQHLTANYNLLKDWRERLETEFLAVSPGSAPPNNLAKQLKELSAQSVNLAKEMRHWIGKVKDTAKKLTLEDQIKVSLRLIMGLSKGDRLRTYALIRDMERNAPDGGIGLHVSER